MGLLVLALGLGVKGIQNRKITTTHARSEANELISGCATSNEKIIFKSGEVFINETTYKVGNYWEANLFGPEWNSNCSRVAYTTGTPSSGYLVYIIHTATKTLTEIDLHSQLEENDHAYTKFIEWQSENEAMISVENQTGEKEYFSVNTETGKINRQLN